MALEGAELIGGGTETRERLEQHSTHILFCITIFNPLSYVSI